MRGTAAKWHTWISTIAGIIYIAESVLDFAGILKYGTVELYLSAAWRSSFLILSLAFGCVAFSRVYLIALDYLAKRVGEEGALFLYGMLVAILLSMLLAALSLPLITIFLGEASPIWSAVQYMLVFVLGITLSVVLGFAWLSARPT